MCILNLGINYEIFWEMSDEDWNEILLNEELSDDLSLQCQVQKRSQ